MFADEIKYYLPNSKLVCVLIKMKEYSLTGIEIMKLMIVILYFRTLRTLIGAVNSRECYVMKL